VAGIQRLDILAFGVADLSLCILPAQFTRREYSIICIIMVGSVVALMLLELLPGKRIRVATNLAFAAGSIFMASQIICFYWPTPKTEGVILSAPFRGDWLVVQGGKGALMNAHYSFANQRNALDIERLVNGQERTGDESKLESYPSWGETLYAPADGKITEVVSNLDDDPIGQSDPEHPVGNHIVRDIGQGHFVMMAHLQKGSVRVVPGEAVGTGQPVAKCGHSGNTSHPHLHIQVQNVPSFDSPGIKTFPILFQNVTCLRGGHPLADPPFFVRHNDRLIDGNELPLPAGSVRQK
jgi:murein DD-endopeptidase MepM/ murein hydrolase activator NlpD